MPKKVKSQTCSQGWCRNHVFELAPIRKDTYLKKIQKIRLCPYFNKNSNKFCRTMPVANVDGKFHTPIFILEDEQDFYRVNDSKILLNLLENTEEDNSEDNQIVTIFKVPTWEYSFCFVVLTQLVPKPGRAKKYCTVCRADYQDYLQHSEAPLHKRNINLNPFSHYMKEMEAKYQTAKTKQLQAKNKQASVPCDQTNWICPFLADLQASGWAENRDNSDQN